MDTCPSQALVLVGERLTLEEVLERVEVDRPFYRSSGGGVTLSGGEPILQARFVTELLRELGARGLHRAVETAGYYPYERLRPLLPHIDLLLYDVKLIDDARHVAATARSNERILANLGRLARSGVALEVRMPIVPGTNTDDENIRLTAEVLRSYGIGELTLLPYNHLWEAKLPRMAMQERALGIRPPEREYYRVLSDRFARYGLDAFL